MAVVLERLWSGHLSVVNASIPDPWRATRPHSLTTFESLGSDFPFIRRSANKNGLGWGIPKPWPAFALVGSAVELVAANSRSYV